MSEATQTITQPTEDTAPFVLTHQVQGIGTITLNRPGKLNILTREMIAAIHTAIHQMAEDAAVRVIILAAEGKAFCAGHDLKEILGQPEAEIASLFNTCKDMMEGIRLASKPVIASVQGVAVAAGCQLVASCDLVMASSLANFGTTGIKAGLFCSTPMVPISRVVQPRKALEMLFTGDLVDATAAEEMGLVNHVVAPEELMARTQDLAARIAANSPYAIGLGKEAFYRQLGINHQAAYEIGVKAMVMNTQAEEGKEGMTAFLEKRTPNFSKPTEK